MVGAATIIYSLCEQSSTSSKVINNETLLRGVQGGGFLEKNPPGRRRQSIEKVSLRVVSPNGDEILQAGEKFLIQWESEPGVEKVKLEYSPDNGSTYFSIASNLDNTGYYEWLVPYHMASGCLVRVSEVKERKVPPVGLFYEVDFRVNGVDSSNDGDIFSIFLGDATNDTIKHNIPGISFMRESNGKSYITLYDRIREIGRSSEFNDRWHNIQVLMDNAFDQISVILDEKLVLENIPRDLMAYFSPALSFSVDQVNTNAVEFDDIVVKAFYSADEKNQWISLFNEDFKRFSGDNGLEKHGWRTKGEQAIESHRKEEEKGAFVNIIPDSALKTLVLQPGNGEQVTVVKSFDIPVDFPFDVSDKPFEIRYNNAMDNEAAVHEPGDAYAGGGHGSSSNYFSTTPKTTALTNSNPGRTQTGTLVDTYYIYSFDNKLMAEYDQNGVCTKEYIYLGNRLLAEYKPQSDEYFYYMTDQINSTRVITNGSGDVVYSEAYSPYGEVQRTWTDNYKPKMKFSGKEREYYSDLDYFGARYYDHKSFRFHSVDPIINRDEALVDPQLWNLYAYCRNNPVTYFDPDGRDSIFEKLKKIVDPVVPKGILPANMLPDTMYMDDWEEHKKSVDKQVEKAIGIAVIIGGVIVVIEISSGNEISGKTPHGEKRAKQARDGDTHRQVGDPNRVVREGRQFYDTESGHTIHTKGNNAIVTNNKGEEVTRFKTSRRNIQKNIKSGKWKPINNE